MGLKYTMAGVDIDESRKPGESPDAMVLRLAQEKALAADPAIELPVLGSDTVVVLGDTVFGKPHSGEDAQSMLGQLSGRRHRVLTAVAIRYKSDLLTAVSQTFVQCRDITPDEAQQYWHTGEPVGKAGAYAIQGLGGVFVSGIDGSYSGVMGLPVFETAELLRQVGIQIPDNALTNEDE